jgi:hypothetical protein
MNYTQNLASKNLEREWKGIEMLYFRLVFFVSVLMCIACIYFLKCPVNEIIHFINITCYVLTETYFRPQVLT